jgi:class 3 adenylate cyclase
LGLTIRAGIHTGEVERAADGKVRGIAVHLASRIAGRANAAEVLVSATIRELAAGSDLLFVDRGKHALKGVNERRRLYAAVGDPGRRSSAAPGQGTEAGELE